LTDSVEILGISVTTYVEYTSTYSMDDGDGNTTYYDYTYTESYSSIEYPDPLDADTDNDLLPDGYEYLQGLNPVNSNDGQADIDSDGLTRGQEYLRGTNPYLADTDGDGHSDGNEVLAGTDPLNPLSPGLTQSEPPVSPLSGGSGSPGPDPSGTGSNSGGSLPPAPPTEWELWLVGYFGSAYEAGLPQAAGEEDPDEDDLTNAEEFLLGTSPVNPDTDGDGLPDGWEVGGLLIDYQFEFAPLPAEPADNPGEDDGSDGNDNSVDEYDWEAPNIESFRSVFGIDEEGGETITEPRYDGSGTAIGEVRRDYGYSGAYRETEVLHTPDGGSTTTVRYLDDGGNLAYGPYVTLTPPPPPPPTFTESFDAATGLWTGVYTTGEFAVTYTWIYTNPLEADSDADGLPDGWEYDVSLRPNDPGDAMLDPDTDGLDNLGEYQNGTDPHRADTDGDGMRDGWEVLWAFEPLMATDALQDADGDTFRNLDEFMLGSHPRDAADPPQPEEPVSPPAPEPAPGPSPPPGGSAPSGGPSDGGAPEPSPAPPEPPAPPSPPADLPDCPPGQRYVFVG
jgi:hypothetical protein